MPHDHPRYTTIDDWGAGVFLDDSQRLALNRGDMIEMEVDPEELRLRIDQINFKD